MYVGEKIPKYSNVVQEKTNEIKIDLKCSFAPLLPRKMRAYTKTQFFFKEFIVLYRVTRKAIV